MANLKIRTKSRRGTKVCGNCGHVVLIGEQYKRYDIRTSQRSSKRIFRCMKSECVPLPNVLTSGHRGNFLTAKYNFDRIQYSSDQLNVKEALEDIVCQLDNVYSDIESGYDNLPDSLKNSTTGVNATDRMDAIENVKNEIESVIIDLEDDEEELTEDQFNNHMSSISSWDDFI